MIEVKSFDNADPNKDAYVKYGIIPPKANSEYNTRGLTS